MEQDKILIANQTFNQEQLDELLNSGTKYDFINCKFNNVNFTEKSNINFISDCEFQSCRFENFHAEGIEANNSAFRYCFFESCNLSNGHFISSKFNGCSFDDSKLNQGNFTFAKIKDTVFSNETNFSAVKFHGAEMDSVYFDNCIVNEAVEGLYKENITMAGATHQEVEVNRSIILDKLKIEPLKELSATQAEINLAAEYEAVHNIPESDKVTQISKNINTVKGNITEPIFTERLNEALLEKGITKEQLNESAYQQQHLDKLQAIAIYEQELNISPEERIVEMNYSTAHWQPKDNISPEQAEAVYNHITDNQRIGFERANEIRHSVGQISLTADEYYGNIKYMAFVSRFDFGDENSIDIEAINKALEEVPTEYVLSKMTEEQQNLFADYYETSLDFVRNADVNLSAADQQLYDAIINIKENNLSITNDSPATEQLSIDNILFDNDNYMHFSVDTDGYRLHGYFRVFDPANGTDMEIVSIDNWDSHPIISEQWDNLTQQCRSASLEKYRELTSQDYSFSNEISESSVEPVSDTIPHLTLNEYLAQQGLASPVDDFMIDKLKLPHGQSKYDERTMHENSRKSSQEYHEKRNAAIQEYQEKVAAGEIIEPTNIERYIKAAQSHPDNASTQAARRVLEKRGYTQNDSGEWILSHSPNEQEVSNSINKKYLNSEKPLTKEEFDKLTSEIKDIAKTYQSDPELLTDYLAFKMQFYNYSPTNAMLIHLQNPHATFVASFTKWKQLGYSIKKGQHHIKISRPIETSKFPKEINGKTVWTDVKYASAEEKAKIASGELEIKKFTKFIPHQVFDISQTNCPIEDYPKFYNMGHPDIEQQQLYECIKQFAKESGFTVTEEDLSSISLHGYYNKADNSIHINSLLEDSKRLETMCHELAHGVLHKTSTQPTEIAEFEAECFGSMLKRKMGFPISEESKRYINQYFKKSDVLQKGKFDMDKTLNRLSKAFNHVTKGINETISNMGFAPEKEIALNLSQAKANAINPLKISENFIQALS